MSVDRPVADEDVTALGRAIHEAAYRVGRARLTWDDLTDEARDLMRDVAAEMVRDEGQRADLVARLLQAMPADEQARAVRGVGVVADAVYALTESAPALRSVAGAMRREGLDAFATALDGMAHAMERTVAPWRALGADGADGGRDG